ncbi:hypothetical protein LTR53_011570 [Teratosphaeriaceae sp. CCFEE 6253]|nr:hypothetical protein LTR53_011570 [Teratosphaeriaceae sp. CCFEE 6253]
MESAGGSTTWGAAPQERPATAGPMQKPSYRLFPSVERTPPASPKGSVSLLRVSNASEPIRRRSSSLDETARMITGPYPHAPRQLHTARRRPSKAIQELPLDSPTVPSRLTFKSFASTRYSEDSYHGRSSSAPSDLVRDGEIASLGREQEMAPQKSPVWMTRQAAASSQTLHGLGLTMQATSTGDSSPGRMQATRGPRQKPNLRVSVRQAEQPDRPPPPPPKSPRHRKAKASAHSQHASFHSRSSSAQSGLSSPTSSRAGSPIAIAQSVACQPVRPMFVNHTSSVSKSSLTKDHLSASTSAAEDRARDLMGSPIVERGRQVRAVFRKPVRPLSKESTHEPDGALVLPSSRFSIASPGSDLSTEGDRTPRAIRPLNIRKATYPYQSPTSSTSSLLVPNTDVDDAPPPTPRKDSCHTQKGSDGSAKQRSIPDRSNSSAAPSHFMIAASARTDHGHARHPDNSPQAPARDRPRRPISPPSTEAALDPTTVRSQMLSPELLASSKGERQSRYDRPTPELPFRAPTPDLGQHGPEDPAEVLRGLARQTEALHARYTSLRSDRQKLSMSIVSSLREPKAGPQYSNTMLDQHLCLAAINSSMDICFAKLKSLDCRKEEAMHAIIAQQGTRRRHSKLRQAASARSNSSLRTPASGRSTPELAIDIVRTVTSASKLRKDSATICSDTSPDRSVHHDPTVVRREALPSRDKGSPELSANVEPDGIESSDAEAAQPRRIRIKGAKAAKLLGLMREVSEGHAGSPGITLPELNSHGLAPPGGITRERSPAIEVHIPCSPFKMALEPPRSPLPAIPSDAAQTPPAPAPKATVESPTNVPSSIAKDGPADTSVVQAPSRAGSAAESAADEFGPQTPQEDEQPLGLKSARRGLVQTIQVFVDDEILDLYQDNSRK